MTHICYVGSKFVWGEDVPMYQASCECGWAGGWHRHDTWARDEWAAHAF